MAEFDELYREVILDHYKNPRGHGVVEPSDVAAEGMNPLCGDEVSISIAFAGDTIEDVRFQGRGCAISQAATSMLMDMVKGRTAHEVAQMDRETLLDGLPTATAYHNGGDMVFGLDGMLYVTVGDAHESQRAQDPADIGGKVLRLAPDGSTPRSCLRSSRAVERSRS